MSIGLLICGPGAYYNVDLEVVSFLPVADAGNRGIMRRFIFGSETATVFVTPSNNSSQRFKNYLIGHQRCNLD